MLKSSDGVSIHSGFPNPATDPGAQDLDLNHLLIKHPASTFMMRLSGNQWEDQGIFNGDIVVVDRAIDPNKKSLVIWAEDGEFFIGRAKEIPAGCTNWGVVTATIHEV